MKTWVRSSLFLLILAAPLAAQTKDPLQRFQEAVQLEESEGDTEAALKLYEELAQGDAPLGLRARAWLRAGRCQETLGKPGLAQAAYEQVVDEFGALAKSVDAARRSLARLKQARKVPARQAARPMKITHRVVDGKRRVSADVEDHALRDVILGIAEHGGLNVVVSPELRGHVTQIFSDLEPLAALELVVQTSGDFVVINDARHGIVRLQTRSSTEQQLETRAFALKRVPMSRSVLEGRQALHRTLANLLAASGVQGCAVELDAAGQVIFATAMETQLNDIKALIGDNLATRAPVAPKVDKKPRNITVHFTDANLRTVLNLAAAYAGEALVISPEVRGVVNVHLKDVPWKHALRHIARSAGDFEVFETDAAFMVVSRSSTEQWLETRAWRLETTPQQFWRSDPVIWGIDDGNSWPAHSLSQAIKKIVQASQIMGATVELDGGSHTLIVTHSAAHLPQLRQALVDAGYLAPKPKRAGPAPELVRLEDSNIRSVLADLARARKLKGLIVSPDIRGNVSGSYHSIQDVGSVIETLIKAAGDFEVVEKPQGTFRVVTRSSLEQQLVTAKFQLTKRPAGSTKSLENALHRVIEASQIQGALVSYNPSGNYFVLSSVPTHVAELRRLIAATDTADVIEAMAGEFVIERESGSTTNGLPEFLVWQLKSDGGWLRMKGSLAMWDLRDKTRELFKGAVTATGTNGGYDILMSWGDVKRRYYVAQPSRR